MRARTLSIVTTLALTAGAAAQPTAFTYQGRLKDGGQLASGPYDLRFKLFDAATSGAQLGSTQCFDNVVVTAGLFTTTIDFGQQFATTAARFLEIEARLDTGLDCNTTTGFLVLGPRQLITAAPRAAQAGTAFGLSSPDGSPANAVSVDSAGNVGIGTTAPGGRLDIQGSNNSNILFGRRTGGGLAHNLFIDGAGNGSMQLLDQSSTPRINLGSGDTTYFNYGNVGIGTITPTAKLDVRGDIRLGPAGQYRATSGEENLRIVRGNIDGNGNILAGSGFQCTRVLEGTYEIQYASPFIDVPSVTATASNDIGNSRRFAENCLACANQVGRTVIRISNDSGTYINSNFSFIVVGPR
jgi:hypothetical protein